jgi:hypothetical protein
MAAAAAAAARTMQQQQAAPHIIQQQHRSQPAAIMQPLQQLRGALRAADRVAHRRLSAAERRWHRRQALTISLCKSKCTIRPPSSVWRPRRSYNSNNFAAHRRGARTGPAVHSKSTEKLGCAAQTLLSTRNNLPNLAAGARYAHV